MGIDTGITGCRAIAFSTEGQILAKRYREYPFSTSKKEIIKSLLEGLCMEIKLSADILAFSGNEINEYTAIGGGGKSREWCQIKADVLGKKVIKIKNEEAACFGAAYLAGIGTGVYRDFSHIQDLIQVEAEFYPDEKNHCIYQQKMEAFKAYYTLKLKQAFH